MISEEQCQLLRGLNRSRYQVADTGNMASPEGGRGPQINTDDNDDGVDASVTPEIFI